MRACHFGCNDAVGVILRLTTGTYTFYGEHFCCNDAVCVILRITLASPHWHFKNFL